MGKKREPKREGRTANQTAPPPAAEEGMAAAAAMAAFAALRGSAQSSGTTKDDERANSSQPDFGVNGMFSDPDADPAAVKALRALWKKDPVTKLKALQSLESIFAQQMPSSGSDADKNRSVAFIHPLLEPWARSFGRLVFDADRRVRIACQTVHVEVVKLAGREIAPFLKALLGPWLCATADSVREVSTGANRALVAAFAKGQEDVSLERALEVAYPKLSAATWFARKALAAYFTENFGKTEQHLIETKVTDQERVAEVLDALRCMSLRALGFVMQVLQTQQKNQHEVNEYFNDNQLLTGDFFRSFIQKGRNTETVRVAAYETLGLVCRVAAVFVQRDLVAHSSSDSEKKAAKSTLQNIVLLQAPLEEPSVLRAAMDSIMAFCFTSKDFHVPVNARKQFFSLLCKNTLRTAMTDMGSQAASAEAVCSAILPLLSVILSLESRQSWDSSLGDISTLVLNALWRSLLPSFAPQSGKTTVAPHIFAALFRAHIDALFFFLHRVEGKNSNSELLEHLESSLVVTLDKMFRVESNKIRGVVVAEFCHALDLHDRAEHIATCEAVSMSFKHIRSHALRLDDSSKRVSTCLKLIAETVSAKMPASSRHLHRLFDEILTVRSLAPLETEVALLDDLLCSLLSGVICIVEDDTADAGNCSSCSGFSRFAEIIHECASNDRSLDLCMHLLCQFGAHSLRCPRVPSESTATFSAFIATLFRGDVSVFQNLTALSRGVPARIPNGQVKLALEALQSPKVSLTDVLRESPSVLDGTECGCYRELCLNNGSGFRLFHSLGESFGFVAWRVANGLDLLADSHHNIEEIVDCAFELCVFALAENTGLSTHAASLGLSIRLVCVASVMGIEIAHQKLSEIFEQCCNIDEQNCIEEVTKGLSSVLQFFLGDFEPRCFSRLANLGERLRDLLPEKVLHRITCALFSDATEVCDLRDLLEQMCIAAPSTIARNGLVDIIPTGSFAPPAGSHNRALAWLANFAILRGFFGKDPKSLFDIIQVSPDNASLIICHAVLFCAIQESVVEFADVVLSEMAGLAGSFWQVNCKELLTGMHDRDRVLPLCFERAASLCSEEGSVGETAGAFSALIVRCWSAADSRLTSIAAERFFKDLTRAGVVYPALIAIKELSTSSHTDATMLAVKSVTMDLQEKLERLEDLPREDVASRLVIWCVAAEFYSRSDAGKAVLRSLTTFCEQVSRKVIAFFSGEQMTAAAGIALGVCYFTLKGMLTRSDAKLARGAEAFRDVTDLWRRFDAEIQCLGGRTYRCFSVTMMHSMALDLLQQWLKDSANRVAVQLVDVAAASFLRITPKRHSCSTHLLELAPFLVCDDVWPRHLSGRQLAELLAEPQFLQRAEIELRGLTLHRFLLSMLLSSAPLIDEGKGGDDVLTAIDEMISGKSLRRGKNVDVLEQTLREDQFVLMWSVVLSRVSNADESAKSFVRGGVPDASSRYEVPRVTAFLDTAITRLVELNMLGAKSSARGVPVGMELFNSYSNVTSWKVGTLFQTALGSLRSSSASMEEVLPFLMSRLILLLFVACLREFPVQFRVWFSDEVRNRRTAEQVQKFIEEFVSPSLIHAELIRVSEVAADAQRLDDALVQLAGESGEAANSDAEFSLSVARATASSSSASVSARYELEDSILSFRLEIPPCFPLEAVPAPVSSVGTGVSSSRWRSWMLGVTAMLATNEASLLEAMLRWKVSMDKHFSGVDTCPICYSLFHVQDRSLPSLPCRTCKNKFHSACMYKWVRVSRNNTCPMCRTPFG